MAVIEVKDLSFKYLGGKDFALRGMDLEVEKGGDNPSSWAKRVRQVHTN
jgi:energy-coupling factor transporter ATP-binding protein EcfA2